MAVATNGSTFCISAEILLVRKSVETAVYFQGFLYFYISIAVISTVMNSVIICVLVFSRELHGTFYIILSSLFVSDFITGSVIFPLFAVLNATFQHPDCLLLDLCQYFVNTISLASILSMMAIAYDRYLRVAKRHTYSMFMTKRKGLTIVVSIWLIAPIFGALNTFIFSKVIAVTAVCIISVILYLYMVTIKKLHTNVNQVTVNIAAQHPIHHDGGVRRSSRLVFILILVILLSWCPSIVVSLMSDSVLYSTNEILLTGLQQLPLISAVSSPFLYFLTNRTTRRTLIRFCCLKVICKNEASIDQNETRCT